MLQRIERQEQGKRVGWKAQALKPIPYRHPAVLGLTVRLVGDYTVHSPGQQAVHSTLLNLCKGRRERS